MAMSELQLREFRAHAEELVDLPDLAELESRGRRLHRRRVALGAGLAAAVLAVTGGLVAADQRDDGDSTPVEPPDKRDVSYPGAVMETLDAGTYVLQPSLENDAPRVRLTLPEGWNAWEGPNRFDGNLDTSTWYAGVLVVEVEAVASEACGPPVRGDCVGETPEELVDALRRAPGFKVTVDEAPTEMFGYPATHLQLRSTPETRGCLRKNNLLYTERSGNVAGGPETLADTWVVDLDGEAILIDVGFTPKTPPEIQDELYEIVDSIEFVDPE
jgi:hypothetical protein